MLRKLKNINKLFWLVLVAILSTACERAPKNDFELNVERVDELKGFVLKGIAISGTVQLGCIANDNMYAVKRDGKQVLETSARILSVSNNDDKPFNGEAPKGVFVTLYIPDGKQKDVMVGDVLSSTAITCGQPAENK